MCTKVLLHLFWAEGVVEIVLAEHCIEETIYDSITQNELGVLATEVLKGIVVRVMAEDAVITFRSDVHKKLEIHYSIMNFWIWCERVIQIKGTILSKLG